MDRPSALTVCLIALIGVTGIVHAASDRRTGLTITHGTFGGSGSGAAPCRLIRDYRPNFPPLAVKRGLQGAVLAVFIVMPDGRARSPRFIYAMPDHLFENSVRESLRSSTFAPAEIDGKAVPCRGTMFFHYEFEKPFPPELAGLNGEFQKVREAARNGDAKSQLIYGLMLVGLPQLRGDPQEAMRAFEAAARSGLATAQYLYGTNLLGGWVDPPDEAAAIDWLRKAAAQDQPDALVTVANHVLRTAPPDVAESQARALLERAVARDHGDAKFHLAALLASASDAKVRDPARALKVLDDVAWDHPKEPEVAEIRAAALAGMGRFDDAVKHQQDAITLARSLEWDTAPLEARLSNYREKQPWFGVLLAR